MEANTAIAKRVKGIVCKRFSLLTRRYNAIAVIQQATKITKYRFSVIPFSSILVKIATYSRIIIGNSNK
jgi:hypothetical protein